MIFKGVCTALVTPFDDNGEVDYVAYEKLIDYQVKSGVDAILILGTTGESATITQSEREKIILFAKSIISSKVKLIVGTGSNNYEIAKKQTLQAKQLGCDGALVVTPYYNKCTQNGLYVFYKKLAQETKFPIIVYNVPSRTGVNILPQTMQKLSKEKYICGLKEANGNIDHIQEMFYLVKGFPIYSGNDNLNNIFFHMGALGAISVVSNVFPRLVKNLYKTKSNKLEQKLYLINKLMFVEVNPIPVKFALFKMGLIKNNLRLPLTKLEKKNESIIEQELKKLEGEM